MLTIKTKTLTLYLSIILAVLYGLSLSSLPHEFFKDRSNYLSFISNSDLLIQIRFKPDNITYTLANEPLFLLITQKTQSFFNLDPESLLYSYAFFICFTVCLFLLRVRDKLSVGILAVALFLSLPHSYGLQLGSIRQSLAMGFLLITLLIRPNIHSKTVLTTVLILGFIHSFYFLIFIMLFIDKTIVRLYGNKIYLRVIYIALFGLLVSFLGLIVAGILGFRQSEGYSSISTDTSGLGFFIWLIVLILLLVNYIKSPPSKSKLQNNIMPFAIIGLTLYLSMYWFSPLAGRTVTFFSLFTVFSVFYRYNLTSFLLAFFLALYGISTILIIERSPSMTVDFIIMYKELISHII